MRTFSVCPADWSCEHPIADAINKIRDAFPNIVVDPTEGARRANVILDRLRTLNAPTVMQDAYAKGATQAVMISVHLPSEYLVEFMLMPGEGIQLHCPEGQEHFAARLATLLDYECEEIG